MAEPLAPLFLCLARLPEKWHTKICGQQADNDESRTQDLIAVKAFAKQKNTTEDSKNRHEERERRDCSRRIMLEQEIPRSIAKKC